MIIGNYDIEVTKKRVKNMGLRITREGKLKMTIPFGVSFSTAEKFVEKNKDWIDKNLNKVKERNKKDSNNNIAVNNEKYYLFGKEYTLSVVKSKIDDVNIFGDNLVLFCKKSDNELYKKRIILKYQKEVLQKYIQNKTIEIEELTGLKSTGFSIKNFKARWGQCNLKNKHIDYNLKLVEKPLECIDYVIIHEHGHIIINGHGKDFKNYMTKFCPNWKELKNKLNFL